MSWKSSQQFMSYPMVIFEGSYIQVQDMAKSLDTDH